jgi:hypothetical protein
VTLRDKAASAIDTSWVELNKLQILQRKASTSNHCIAIARTSVGTRAAEVRSTVTPRCEDRFVSPEAVECTVFHAERNDSSTLTILHDQIQHKVFNEEFCVVSKRLAVKSVEEGMTGAISGRSTAVCLTAFAIIQRLTTNGTLVYLSIFGTGEWNTITFELETDIGGTNRHVRSNPTSATDPGASRHI